MEQQTQENIAIVIVPFPAQGHLNQLLHFALHLSSRGLPVHFASSSTHNRQARTRVQGWDPTAVDNLHFHDLTIPPFATPPSDPNSLHKFPSHLIPAFEAFMHIHSPLGSLFRSLSSSSRRLVVVHDTFIAFPCSEAEAIPNAESYRFLCVATSFHLSVYQEALKMIKDKLNKEVCDVTVDPFVNGCPPEFWEFVFKYQVDLASDAGCVMNTCRAIEGEFIESMALLPQCCNKKLFAVGPMNPVIAKSIDGDKCLEWLDKQGRASVLYVSFGSTTTISDEQIEQLAIGLERSGQRFIWVLRDADVGDIFVKKDDDDGSCKQRKLPTGFEERIEGVGLVVRDWAPQLEILAHGSTGGFMSHCGWNSCMESLSYGVPIIAWPMHADQPKNAMMVTDYLKVGVAVRDWDPQEEVVSACEIERSIVRVMVDDEGLEIRKRADALGEDIRQSVGENGLSRADLDSFVAHITRE